MGFGYIPYGAYVSTRLFIKPTIDGSSCPINDDKSIIEFFDPLNELPFFAGLQRFAHQILLGLW